MDQKQQAPDVRGRRAGALYQVRDKAVGMYQVKQTIHI